MTAADAPPVAGERKRDFRGLAIAFALTWLAYGSYYLCRKNFSVAKSAMQGELGLSDATLATIDTAYLAAYAIGQFASGRLGDRVGARRLVGFGMLATAALSIVFGFGRVGPLFVLAFGLNGFAQSTGWPGTVKAMAEHTEPKTRGRVMGIWGTCYMFGGIAASAVAGFVLAHHGWRATFWVPAIFVAGVGILVLAFLRPGPGATMEPSEKGVTSTDRTGDAQRRVLENPLTWCYGAAYFALKIIRYSILFWLPFYLERALGLKGGTPAYLSTSFEIGGVVGTVLIGIASDRMLHRIPRAAFAMVSMIGLAGALFLYGRFGSLGMSVNFAAMALVGALLFAADSLLSGAAAQDIGGAHGAAMAAGVVNGVGSVGAVLQGWITLGASKLWGWDGLFYAFLVLSLLGAAALVPALKRPASAAAPAA
jgi:sugar phosphate permease